MGKTVVTPEPHPTTQAVKAAVDQAMVEKLGFDSKGRRPAQKRDAISDEAYPAAWEVDMKHVVAGETETVSRSRTHFDNGVLGFLSLVANMNAVAVRVANNGAFHDHLTTCKSIDAKGIWLDKMARLDESTLALKHLYRPTTPDVEAVGASIASRALDILNKKVADAE